MDKDIVQGSGTELQHSPSMDIKSYVQRLSREPFQNILSDILGAQPTPERLMAFASENPDKWASMIKTFAGLAGYKEEIEINNNFIFKLQNMSDAELMQELESNTLELELDLDSAPASNSDSTNTQSPKD